MSRRNMTVLVALVLTVALSGCGGGGASTPPPSPPPPPAPSPGFTIAVTNTVTVQQDGLANTLGINITTSFGFAGTITLALQNLPAGVSASPGSGATLVAGSNNVVVMATSQAPVGNHTVTVLATSGALSRSATFTLSVTPVAAMKITLAQQAVSLSSASAATVQITLTSTSGSITNASLSIQAPFGAAGQGISVTGPGLLFVNQPASLIIEASPFVESKTAQFQLSVSQGGDSSVAYLEVTTNNPFQASAPPVRTTFLRTGAQVDSAVYDPVRQLVFATVHDLHQVDVYTRDGQRVSSISVTRPVGIDQAPDGRILVGTRTRFLYVIDPDSFEILNRVPAAFHSPGPGGIPFALRPIFVKATSNGKAIVIAQEANTTGTLLYEWDLATNNFVQLPGVQFDSIARSGDYSTVVVARTHSAGSVTAVYDSATGTLGPTVNLPTGLSLVVSPDGSHIVVGNSVYDRSLTEIKSGFTNFAVPGTFSRDGGFLFASMDATTLVAAVAVFETQNYTLVGLVSSLHIDHFAARPVDVDDTGMVFATTQRGLVFVDASQPRALAFTPPAARMPNAFEPPQGTITSPGMSTLNGVGFIDGAQVLFGPSAASPQTTPASGVSVLSTNEIQLTVPGGSMPGPVHVTITQPGGWSVLVPEAFTYGPHVLAVEANAGPASGGTSVRVFGYGFKFDQNQIGVTVGGRAASVTSVFPFAGVTPYSFPLHNFVFVSPPGSPGLADIQITTPAGTTTVANGFQYLAQANVFPTAGTLSQVIFDRSRGKLFAANSGQDRVDVFGQDGAAVGTLPAGFRPSTLALTSDATKLAVGHAVNGSIMIVNPDTSAVLATVSGLNPALASCADQRLSKISAVKPQRLLVQSFCTDQFAGGVHLLDMTTLMSGCGASSGCNSLLTTIHDIGFGVYAATSPDGRWVFGVMPTLTDSFVALWDVDTDSFTASRIAGSLFDAAVAHDGNWFTSGFRVFGPMLLEDRIAFGEERFTYNTVFGSKLHPSGSLLYVPQSNAVDIYDVHRGRQVLRVGSPDPVLLNIDAMAIDEHGRKIFLTTTTGLTILELARVPLSIGYSSPAQASSAGGSQITIRGSGFVNGAVVHFGALQVPTTFIDESTLAVSSPALPPGPVRLTVTNPDGTQYSLDAAFRVN